MAAATTTAAQQSEAGSAGYCSWSLLSGSFWDDGVDTVWHSNELTPATLVITASGGLQLAACPTSRVPFVVDHGLPATAAGLAYFRYGRALRARLKECFIVFRRKPENDMLPELYTI